MISALSLLKERNLTVTPQRVEIVNLLFKHRHINVDELYALLNVSFPSISLATVYKNINIMLEKMLLSEVQIPGKKNVYEVLKHEHAHVNCTICNEILDIDLDTQDIVKEVQLQSGFILETASMIFSGTCAKCKH